MLASAGCAVPLKQRCDGWFQGAGKCIDRKELAPIVPRETTKDDVIRILGYPDRMDRDGTVYVYEWEMASWAWFIGAGTSGAGGVFEKSHVFLVAFDGRGRVLRREEKEGYSHPGREFSAEPPVTVDNVGTSGAPAE
jgi:hypothetical protein